MIVQPYLFFDGRCDEALEFYRSKLGAEVTALVRYKESPDPNSGPPGAGDKVIHSNFRIGETTLMASDSRCQGQPTLDGFSLSLTAPNEAEADRLFAALAEWRTSSAAVVQDIFLPELRDGHRSFRRAMDGYRAISIARLIY
jgi:PhnB protein